MIDAPKIIERSDPRTFCNEVLGKMSKRDKDDLRRIQVTVGEIVLLRMTAARYMDRFVSSEVDAIYNAFGVAVENAYQAMIAKLGEIDERKKTLAHVLKDG